MAVTDPLTEERFRRVVGTRLRPALGSPPSAETRAALAQLANYATGAPKGVFRYRSHEEANAHREQCTLARLLAEAER